MCGLLKAMWCGAGEDEALITELAGCLGEWAVHAAATDLAATLQQGALSRSPAASPFERQGRALTVAFTIQCGLPRCRPAVSVSSVQVPSCQESCLIDVHLCYKQVACYVPGKPLFAHMLVSTKMFS